MQLKPSGRSGFTLLETIIVLAIIGLLLGVAIPNFVKAREAEQLKAVARDFHNTEGAKRQLALESKKPSRVTLRD
jgi:prepilin-type N-terminal cleavage/methylation domain-containing protein